MPDLTFEVEYLKDVQKGALVVLSGAIDAKTVPGFQENLNKLKDAGVIRFVLDMENVKYVNSTGLGYLVNLADNVDPQGGAIALVRVHPKVKVVFDMLGLNAFFKINNSRKEAIETLKALVPGGGGGAAQPQPAVAEPPAPPTPKMDTHKFGPGGGGPQRAPAGGAGTAVAMPVMQQSAPPVVQPQAQPEPMPVAEGPTVECTVCKSGLLVPEPGTFKCPRCSAIFTYVKDGKANFLPRRKLSPIQMTLTCSPECTESLCFLVALMGKKVGFPDDRALAIHGAVREAVTAIIEQAYGKNDQCTYQVLLVCGDNELNVKFADYGKRIDINSSDGSGKPIFSFARQVMDVVDLKPHPRGGNILTMTKRG
ncbi:MAG: anti-sigma factor antagonist [Planctomycetes bacterium]|nr:anti-sigma factor antagonist [Planctomycetota bacterium]